MSKSVALVLPVVTAVVLWISCSNQNDGTKLSVVKPVDLNSVNPELFTQDEWFVPYYLKNFSQVANSLVDSGKNRGYINIVVWRTPDVNKPYNARIMESILSLVWFYTNDRPWNPYYNDPALKKRIEAALTFWCNIQNGDGRFSEYAEQRWSLAPTAFATKFIGRALYLLEEGPSIDEKILARANESLRKALFISFTDSALWAHGRNFTNQYANLWGGAMMYLQHHTDPIIDQLLTNRLDESMTEFQSPCGYFYEKNGPDWGYNLSTHHSDLQVAWHYAKDTRLQDYFIDKTAAWYNWFSYNAVKEPGTSRFYLNKAVETRQQKWYVDSDTLEDPRSARWTPQAELVPMARAFVLSQEEYDAAADRYYQKMRDQYPNVKEFEVGEFWSFSPYAFLHNEMNRWLPSRKQKEEATKELPYLKHANFTEVRSDRRNGTEYSFVRRPSYYAIFNSGKIITDQQRYGFGLIWNPSMGTVFQSQSRSDTAAWGTRASDQTQVYEAGDVDVTFSVDEQPWTPAPGSNEIEGRFSLSYALGSNGAKKIKFNEDNINVDIKHKGIFTEVVPLLIDESTRLTATSQVISLENTQSKMVIRIEGNAQVTETESFDTHGGKPGRVIEIQARGELKYSIRFDE